MKSTIVIAVVSVLVVSAFAHNPPTSPHTHVEMSELSAGPKEIGPKSKLDPRPLGNKHAPAKPQESANVADKKQKPPGAKATSASPQPSNTQRNLLSQQSGPADAFNKASHTHKRTNEAASPSKAHPALPLPTHGAEAGLAKRPVKPLRLDSSTTPKPPQESAAKKRPSQSTPPSAKTTAPTNTQRKESGPADAFNKATKKHKPQQPHDAGAAHHHTDRTTPKPHVSALTKKPAATTTTPVPAAAQRNLLAQSRTENGSADAFNKASHNHKATKEAASTGKTIPTRPLPPNGAETGPKAKLIPRTQGNKPVNHKPQESANIADKKKKPAATSVASTTTQPSATPAAAPNTPSKDAAGRNLLQWGGGWSGSQAQAQAQAQSGSFGGWGGSGAQAQAQAQSQSLGGGWGGSMSQAQAQAQAQSFGGGYGGGWGNRGYGWGRKLMGAQNTQFYGGGWGGSSSNSWADANAGSYGSGGPWGGNSGSYASAAAGASSNSWGRRLQHAGTAATQSSSML